MRKLTLSGAALAMITAVAACGGGGSSKATTTLPLTSNSRASSPNDTLSKLVENAGKQKYKITFTYSNGPAQTYEQDGNGNSVYTADGSQTFLTKTTTTNCATSSGTAVCTQSPRAAGDTENPFTAVLGLERDQFSTLGGNVGTPSDKTIAGRDARCVTFTNADLVGGAAGDSAPPSTAPLGGSYSYCIDLQTGVMLMVSTTDSSGQQVSALAVTKFETPSPSDFTPPAKPSLPGGG